MTKQELDSIPIPPLSGDETFLAAFCLEVSAKGCEARGRQNVSDFLIGIATYLYGVAEARYQAEGRQPQRTLEEAKAILERGHETAAEILKKRLAAKNN